MAIQAKATQEFVPITEVKDGVLVLKDGSLRSIIMASSLNFALKNEEEKNAIIYQFQNFLNSLDFSIQIFIQSRKLDIRPYLGLIEQRYKEEINELMKIQIQEYIGFVRNFTETTNIMTKNFFIVVPYSPAFLQTNKSAQNILKFGKKDGDVPKLTAQEIFEENRTQLDQRVAVVEQGLARCGVRTVILGSEEVVELFYKIFNPGETQKAIQIEK